MRSTSTEKKLIYSNRNLIYSRFRSTAVYASALRHNQVVFIQFETHFVPKCKYFFQEKALDLIDDIQGSKAAFSFHKGVRFAKKRAREVISFY